MLQTPNLTWSLADRIDTYTLQPFSHGIQQIKPNRAEISHAVPPAGLRFNSSYSLNYRLCLVREAEVMNW